MKPLLVGVAFVTALGLTKGPITCGTPDRPPVIGPDASDGGPVSIACFVGDPAGSDLEKACSHLCDLRCPSVQPTPSGHKCVEVLGTETSVRSGGWLACLAKAASCDAANGCK